MYIKISRKYYKMMKIKKEQQHKIKIKKLKI